MTFPDATFDHRHVSDVGDAYWKRVEKTDSCWIWRGWIAHNGYGRAWDAHQGRTRVAHRFHWEKLHGPVPAGMELDHLCRNRACVNPDHLEAVTPRENVRRGTSPAAQHARQETCKYGHPFTRRTSRQRVCGVCEGDARRRYMARHPEAIERDRARQRRRYHEKRAAA